MDFLNTHALIPHALYLHAYTMHYSADDILPYIVPKTVAPHREAYKCILNVTWKFINVETRNRQKSLTAHNN